MLPGHAPAPDEPEALVPRAIGPDSAPAPYVTGPDSAPVRRGAADAEELAGMVPLAAALDDTDSPGDVIDVLALGPFATGRQPWARTASLSRVRDDAALVPPGARVLWRAVSDGRDTVLAVGEGWTLHVARWSGQRAEVTVTATREDLARAVLATATDGVIEPEPVDETVPIGFWYRSPQRGPLRTVRPISSDPWPGVRRNYAAPVVAAMDRLMRVTSADITGRLILLHGPPGTGKTTALRTLAWQWRSWCQVDCVLDPESLFSDPSYLMEVAIGSRHPVSDDDDENRPRWRLLLLEDCDELIRDEAKRAAGQALSRLLNLTDGLLGQGRDVLVAITTNEELNRLHPAVVRPGRCLAQIEVGPLSRAEATAWLGSERGIGPGGATLAHLYALRNGTPEIVASEPEPLPGLYM